MNWFVLSTLWKREREAAKRLIQQGFTVYLPLIRCYRRQHGNTHLTKTLVPVFERYLFVRMDWARRGSVLATRGVRTFTGWSPGMAMAPQVRPQVMAELMARLRPLREAPRPVLPDEPAAQQAVAAGQLIRLMLGQRDSLAQVEAVFGRKVQVLLGFAGAPRRAFVTPDQIRTA